MKNPTVKNHSQYKFATLVKPVSCIFPLYYTLQRRLKNHRLMINHQSRNPIQQNQIENRFN
ncbi:hypothetical protein CF168_02545 [Shewanella bicestrii]|uniref:Uncharacterized protein n=1 Tax=Shewanella bicestrii TaxID=2018305 RepID=A0A220UJF0_9GAMM|nr:hypothetical protein CF168_02545 [Shewanella bicestrii]